jgi:hypothetical protein
LRRYRDESYRLVLGGQAVRVIDARITALVLQRHFVIR